MANTKRNTPREDAETTAPTSRSTAGRKRKETTADTGEGRFARFKAFLTDERTHKVGGLFLVLGSAYLLVAFTSFLFTWRIDQDLIGRSWGEIFSPEVRAENWLGKIGALTANQFIYKWFGVAAFGLVLWNFLAGVRILLGKWLLPVKRTLGWTAMAMLWFPTVLGFLFRGEYIFLGGGIGFAITKHLTGLLGNFGTGALIVFALGAFITFTFNTSFGWLGDALDRLKPAPKAQEEAEDVAEAAAVAAVAGVRVRAVKPTAEELAAADQVLAEEESFEEAEESMEEEEVEDVDQEDLALTEEEEEELEVEPMALELETAPLEVLTPVASPVMSATDGLETDVDGMSVTAGAADKVLSEDQIEEKLKEFGEYDPTLDLSSYELPPIDLLVDHGTGELTVTREELEANKDRIVQTLGHYNIGIDKIKATIGPTVTLYEIIPQAGVRISKIKNLEDDIALSLAALGIRIIAPIPGKGTIGIEVPNSKPQVVGMRGVIASEKFQNSSMDLPLVLGKTISNETFVTDLTKMPHLLMAGATGQGKSVGLNAILVSLLYKKHPSQIKFVLVDPKKVELTLFNKIERHFLAKLPGDSDAIITDTKKVVATLNSLCIEMDERYELLKDAQVRNIKEYNAKFIQRRLNPENGHRYLPYIVLVVDEFADLIMTAGREVETPIARLAQLARAIGIHLIIATQRPSVNIITGTIKANFPARIAFRVTSKIDSRTILDAGGADQLI
ncbi:MAG: DNA translocase FtsK 4TM domain-containing protein, partial [Flavobacteriales bacterium]